MKIRALKSFALVLGATLTLSACGLMSNDSRYEPVDLTDYQQKIQAQKIWSVSIGSGSGHGFTPVLVQDSIFAATPDGQVVRVNVSTGAVEWRVKLDKSLAGGVGVGEGLVAVTTRDGQLQVLDAVSGQAHWSSRTSTISSTPPVIGNGMVVVRADDFRVQGFNVADGTLAWSYVRTNPEMSLKTNSRMVFADANTILAAVPTGRLVAINTKNGRLVWELLAATVKGPTDLDSVTDVVGQPILYGNEACFASYQGNVVCYNFTQNGPALSWAQPFSSAVGIDAAPSAIVSSGVDGTLTSFARQNGQVVWTDTTLKNRGLTNPIVFNNYVVVADYEGYAHFYDFNSGTLLGRISLGDSDPVVSPLIATQKGVVAQTGDGDLVLFGAK